MLKKIIYISVIAGFLGAGIGYYMFNKPVDSIASLKTDYVLNADKLLTLFEDDETEANEKYLDKVIEVSGIVGKVKDENGKTSVYITTANDLSNIIFQLESSDKSIKEGDQITMKGICTGYLMDVVLVRATKV